MARRGPHCVHEGTAGRGGPCSWRRAARPGRIRFGPGGRSAFSRPRARGRPAPGAAAARRGVHRRGGDDQRPGSPRPTPRPARRGLGRDLGAGGLRRGSRDRDQRELGPPRRGRAGGGEPADRRLRRGAGRAAAGRARPARGGPGRRDRVGPATQLQGARKLSSRGGVSEGLRAAIERSAELTKSGLADARQAVGALRGERLPALDQLAALVEDFRRDTGADATLRIDGTTRLLPAEASLALFRGTQEALTNISRYAPGTATSIVVSYLADRTLVIVEDHACGTEAGALSPILAHAGRGPGPTASRGRAP